MSTTYTAERDEQLIAALLGPLKTLVELESPSEDFVAVTRVQDVVEGWARELGASCHALPGGTRQFIFGGADNHKPLLLLAHADTVWPHGTLAHMPFRLDGERVYGPGSYDMKGGIVGAFAALRMLQHHYPAGGIHFLLTPDEETGSLTSRSNIEQAAREARAVLVLEPPIPGTHALKTGRKGVGDYTLQLTGVAAHAGNEPEQGASAIYEAALQVLDIEALARPTGGDMSTVDTGTVDTGTTVSVGRITGGTAVNVIPAQARLDIDVRVSTLAEGERIAAALQALKAHNPRVQLALSGELNRPPFERTPATLMLYHQAQRIAQQLGFEIGEGVVGGGSDGNLTAPLCPTLDGLGAPGDGAHAQYEHIRLDRWPQHIRLLAGLLQEV